METTSLLPVEQLVTQIEEELIDVSSVLANLETDTLEDKKRSNQEEIKRYEDLRSQVKKTLQDFALEVIELSSSEDIEFFSGAQQWDDVFDTMSSIWDEKETPKDRRRIKLMEQFLIRAKNVEPGLCLRVSDEIDINLMSFTDYFSKMGEPLDSAVDDMILFYNKPNLVSEEVSAVSKEDISKKLAERIKEFQETRGWSVYKGFLDGSHFEKQIGNHKVVFFVPGAVDGKSRVQASKIESTYEFAPGEDISPELLAKFGGEKFYKINFNSVYHCFTDPADSDAQFTLEQVIEDIKTKPSEFFSTIIRKIFLENSEELEKTMHRGEIYSPKKIGLLVSKEEQEALSNQWKEVLSDLFYSLMKSFLENNVLPEINKKGDEIVPKQFEIGFQGPEGFPSVELTYQAEEGGYKRILQTSAFFRYGNFKGISEYLI